MPVIYQHTTLATSPKAAWMAYFDCIGSDERDGIKTTDDERARFWRMWKRGTVVWRDDGELARQVGLHPRDVPDAVKARKAGQNEQ